MESLLQISNLKVSAQGKLHALSKLLLENRRPPPGAYAAFYEISNSLEKVETCYLLTERLFESAEASMHLMQREATLLPRDWAPREPYLDDVDLVIDEERKVSRSMLVDFESLYMFGGILLDQWALVAARMGSAPMGSDHPFKEMTSLLEAGRGDTLQPVWDELRESLLWLHFHVRHYRNKFIVHANRPWQRGTTQALGRIEFRLFTPTPVGWLDEAKVHDEIISLSSFGAVVLPSTSPDELSSLGSRNLLTALFENIGLIPGQYDRERIAALYAQVGGSTPTFQVVATRLFRFIAEGTERLHAIAESRLGEIDLGAPHKTSVDLESSTPAVGESS